MVLVTDEILEGAPVELRMVWYNITLDAPDWNWERSDDGGETWQFIEFEGNVSHDERSER